MLPWLLLNELRICVGMCLLSTCDLLRCLSDCLSDSSQYSVKEDKYELTITNLTEKLKEVRMLVPWSLVHQSGAGNGAAARYPAGGATQALS